MKIQLIIFWVCLLSLITACITKSQSESDTPPAAIETPLVTEKVPPPDSVVTTEVPAIGTGIADLLNDPLTPNASAEIDAYFSGANPFLMPGGGYSIFEDRINCPGYLNNLLTDSPFLPGLSVLRGGMSNMPAAETPWFLAATQETAQPGAYPQADLPYHARLRGRLGDPVFAECENRDRIFLVEEIVTVYAEDVPNPPLHIWELPPDYVAEWPRYEDEALGFSFSYPPDWQIEPGDARGLAGSLLIRFPDRPDFPVLLRVHHGEAQLDRRSGETLEPPTLKGKFMQPFVQGDGVGTNIPHNQNLPGFIGETEPTLDRRFMAAYFLGDGRTYEIALAYPMGFAASQTLMTGYSVIVESFRLDFLPDPTPTALPLPHDTATPIPFGEAPPPPTETPTPTATPVTAVPLSIENFELRQVEELNPGKRLTFDWLTNGASGVCLVSGTARRMGPWWSLPLSGTLTVDVNSTLYRDPDVTLQAFTGEGYCNVPEAPPDSQNHVAQSILLAWDCGLDYFFAPAPQRCPLSPAVDSVAAEQLFENGRMIWLESSNEILVFYNNGQFSRYENGWQPDDPESDPSLIPPDGFYQPIRGFGKIWREQPAVREHLGWGVAPEQGFSTIIQSEHHEGSSSGSPTYLRTSDGQIIWYFGLSSGNWGMGLP